MNNVSLRNVLILLAAVIVALLALGFVSTLLNQIIPITIALVVGVVLGRLSAKTNVITLIRDALRRQPQQTDATVPQTTSAEQPAQASDDQIRREADSIKQRLMDDEPDRKPDTEPTDFDIKTEEEILAEARRLEADVAKRSSDYDPAAALAERRRRLLGDQADQS